MKTIIEIETPRELEKAMLTLRAYDDKSLVLPDCYTLEIDIASAIAKLTHNKCHSKHPEYTLAPGLSIRGIDILDRFINNRSYRSIALIKGESQYASQPKDGDGETDPTVSEYGNYFTSEAEYLGISDPQPNAPDVDIK